MDASVNIALMITIMGITLYAFGQAFLVGYLKFFNLEPYLFNLSVQDKVYVGFIQSWGLLLGIAITVYVIYAIFLIFQKKKKKKQKQHESSCPPVHTHTKNLEEDKRFNFIYGMFSFPMIFLLLSMLGLGMVERWGYEKAWHDFNNLKGHHVLVESNHQHILGNEIICGVRVCAVLNTAQQVMVVDTKMITFLPKFEKKAQSKR